MGTKKTEITTKQLHTGPSRLLFSCFAPHDEDNLVFLLSTLWHLLDVQQYSDISLHKHQIQDAVCYDISNDNNNNTPKAQSDLHKHIVSSSSNSKAESKAKGLATAMSLVGAVRLAPPFALDGYARDPV